MTSFEPILKQLIAVRQRARGRLVAWRLGQGLMVVPPVLLLAAVLDGLLRLPGTVRLGLLLLFLGVWLTWLVAHVRLALRFVPSLEELALRAEAVAPDLRGKLAVAVAFAQQAEKGALERQVIDEAAEAARQVDFARLLINPAPVRPVFGWAGASVCGLVLAAVLAGAQSSCLLAQRWLLPWSDAAWPTRQGWVDQSGLDGRVLPLDEPVAVSAMLTQGVAGGGETFEVQLGLVAGDSVRWLSPVWLPVTGDQVQGELLLSRGLPADVQTQLKRGELARQAIRWRGRFGDAQRDMGVSQVVVPPRLVRAEVQVEDPPWLTGPQRRVQAARQPLARQQTVHAGSRWTLTLDFNKPLPVVDLETCLPGLAGLAESVSWTDQTNQGARGLELRWVQPNDTVITALMLEDADGLPVHVAERATAPRWIFAARHDGLPVVQLGAPQTDVWLTPQATLPLAVSARDDVALTELSFELARDGQLLALPEALTAHPDLPEAHVAGVLDLADQPVAAGEVWVLRGQARDGWRSEDETHAAVFSTPRRLHVVTPAEHLARLAGRATRIGKQAQGLADRQAALIEVPVTQDQASLHQEVRQADADLQALRDELARNHSGTTDLGQTLDAAAVAMARAASETSAPEAVVTALREVAALLGLGARLAALQSEAQALLALQDALRKQTEALARAAALGEAPDAQALAELQAQQEDLARRVQALMDQLHQLEQIDPDDLSSRAMAATAAQALQAGQQSRAGQSAQDAGGADGGR